jgi:hypothetical protein
MDVAIVLAVLIFTYVIAIYNRMQTLWQGVREGLANVEMEAGTLADLSRRVTDRPGDLPPLAGRLAEVEQNLLLRRGRCNAAIAAYNTYRAQIPQIMLSRLAGFGPVEFPAIDRAPVSLTPVSPAGAEIVQLDVPNLRAVTDPVVVPWPQQRPESEGAERRPPRP